MADGAIVSHGSDGAVPPCPALPRRARGAFASGVGDLDGDLGGADPVTVIDDARERRFAGVGVETEAAVADAAAPLHVAHFGDHKTGAGIGQQAQMGLVPVGRHAVIGAVLAHRGDDDAVREVEAGEPNGREQYACHATLERCQAASRSITGASGSGRRLRCCLRIASQR